MHRARRLLPAVRHGFRQLHLRHLSLGRGLFHDGNRKVGWSRGVRGEVDRIIAVHVLEHVPPAARPRLKVDARSREGGVLEGGGFRLELGERGEVDRRIDLLLVREEALRQILEIGLTVVVRLEEFPSAEGVPQEQRFALVTLDAVLEVPPTHAPVGHRTRHRDPDLLRGVVRLGLAGLQSPAEVVQEGGASKSSLREGSGSGRGQQKGNRERRALHFFFSSSSFFASLRRRIVFRFAWLRSFSLAVLVELTERPTSQQPLHITHHSMSEIRKKA
mmetsp:Transcript_10827/g.30465  ORF Transcript_10827/g.30465 Transcript_10827/m.30465 type:complete len:275 (+) Transcript_10827:93-917(+)